MSAASTIHAAEWVLTNGRVVTPDRVIENGHIVIADGRIDEIGIGGVERDVPTFDVDGRLLLPGFVDLHGDDLERYRFPRSDAEVEIETALLSCDLANIAAGITTKFHAVAFEDVPDEHRSVELANEAVTAITAADGLLGHNRVNARCELGDDRAVEAVFGAIDREVVGLVSLMNHLPNCGQFDDLAQFERRYHDGDPATKREADRLRRRRRRISTDGGDERPRRLIRAARTANIPVASHDDEDPAEIDALAELDVSISEYPVTMAAAKRAVERGLTTAMGAPNLVRGGSLWGNLSAPEAIREDVVDVLCTDYHPASLLEAIFVDTGEPLPDRVSRVTAAPADAVGLDDRGRLETGARADIVVVDPSAPPRVQHAIVDGEEVFRRRPTMFNRVPPS